MALWRLKEKGQFSHIKYRNLTGYYNKNLQLLSLGSQFFNGNFLIVQFLQKLNNLNMPLNYWVDNHHRIFMNKSAPVYLLTF